MDLARAFARRFLDRMADENHSGALEGKGRVESTEITIGNAAIEKTMIGANNASLDAHAVRPEKTCREKTGNRALMKRPHGLIVQDACFAARLPARAMQPKQIRQ